MVKRAVRESKRPIGGSRGQLEGLGGQIHGRRAVRGSQRPIGGSRGQLEGLRGQLADLGASQRVWDASQGVTAPAHPQATNAVVYTALLKWEF